MSLTNITTKELSKISKLIEQKENYQAKIVEIDSQLAALESGQPVKAAPQQNGSAEKPKRAARRAKKTGKAKRGGLRDSIIQELQSAGKGGLHVKELSSRLGVKDPNIRVWFYSTGKKFPQIKQVSPATYAWVK